MWALYYIGIKFTTFQVVFILADGMIFSVDGIKGILYLIEPDSEGFRELSSAKQFDTNQCWAPLALSDGKLLIRYKKQMKCVNVR